MKLITAWTFKPNFSYLKQFVIRGPIVISRLFSLDYTPPDVHHDAVYAYFTTSNATSKTSLFSRTPSLETTSKEASRRKESHLEPRTTAFLPFPSVPRSRPVAVREASVVGVVVSVAFASARDDDDDDDDDDDAEGPPDHLGCSFDTIVESSSSSSSRSFPRLGSTPRFSPSLPSSSSSSASSSPSFRSKRVASSYLPDDPRRSRASLPPRSSTLYTPHRRRRRRRQRREISLLPLLSDVIGKTKVSSSSSSSSSNNAPHSRRRRGTTTTVWRRCDDDVNDDTLFCVVSLSLSLSF